MLSIDYIRANKDLVAQSAKNKNRQVDLDALLRADDERRALLMRVETLRSERNELAKKNDPSIRDRARAIKDELKVLEEKLSAVEGELNELLLQVPNVPLSEVPVGPDESGNVQVRVHGTIPTFSFEPKTHIELCESLGLADFERGNKVSGFRGYFLKGPLATIQMGLMMYAMQFLTNKGYVPLVAPSLVKGFTLFGNGQFPWGESEVYKTQDDDAYLAGTAEVPVTAYFAKETLKRSDLPQKFVAFSPCFRREIGSYGRDTKGLYRVHEFWKIEQVVLCESDVEKAKIIHEELQQNSEELLQSLELPYRVLLMCTGDMGEPQIKKYDIETWMPSRQAYGETMSNSIMGDFQARRLNLKYKNEQGESNYCYTLNNTALACPRILIPLLENHQQPDGSIRIPKVLQPFVGFDTINPQA